MEQADEEEGEKLQHRFQARYLRVFADICGQPFAGRTE
jgi:hypothetical protein